MAKVPPLRRRAGAESRHCNSGAALRRYIFKLEAQKLSSKDVGNGAILVSWLSPKYDYGFFSGLVRVVRA